MTLHQRYEELYKNEVGAIPTLKGAVWGQNYGKGTIIAYFNKVVPKEEYSKSEKDEILEDLFQTTLIK